MEAISRLAMAVKAQAAMEFLMTYGWAILVVLIIIGALAVFGVLSPSTLLPEKCTFPVSLSCLDHTVTPTYVAVSLQNGAGRDMIIRAVTATSDALQNGGTCRTAVNSGNIPPDNTDTCLSSTGLGADGCTASSQLRNGETTIITMLTAHAGGSCDYNANIGRDQNKYNITLFYSWSDSPNIVHSMSGELLAGRP